MNRNFAYNIWVKFLRLDLSDCICPKLFLQSISKNYVPKITIFFTFFQTLLKSVNFIFLYFIVFFDVVWHFHAASMPGVNLRIRFDWAYAFVRVFILYGITCLYNAMGIVVVGIEIRVTAS